MLKKTSPCGRKDKHVEVEDHGNGYMFIGCSDIDQAKRLIEEYVDDPADYQFAARVWDKERAACCVWLADHPGAVWDGALDPLGNPVPR